MVGGHCVQYTNLTINDTIPDPFHQCMGESSSSRSYTAVATIDRVGVRVIDIGTRIYIYIYVVVPVHSSDPHPSQTESDKWQPLVLLLQRALHVFLDPGFSPTRKNRKNKDPREYNIWLPKQPSAF